MKRVEKKGFNSKREMEVMDALSEVKQLNKRMSKVNHEELLIKTLARHDAAETDTVTSLNGGTDEELKQRYSDLVKYKRLQEDQNYVGDDFESLLEIDDPYEWLKQTEQEEDN